MDGRAAVDDIAARYTGVIGLGRAPSRTNKGDGMTKPRIGFIGVGMMGHGMAKNLVMKGFPSPSWRTRNRSRLQDLLTRARRRAQPPAELAKGSDIVFLCVTGRRRWRKTSSARTASFQPRARDSWSSTPPRGARLDREDPRGVRRRGATFVDAPLARTPKEAEEGRLNTMVGATRPTSSA
jgi:3-hydroxyisobutyrate dehydrogenase-like beta-hydroxyacid dehydrogenase